jgi:hypothetical protein
VHTFRRRRKSTAEPLGRSPGLEGANHNLPIRWPLHLPRLMGRVVIRSDAPSLTVAGPRRIFTGLPFYALVGTQGKWGC